MEKIKQSDVNKQTIDRKMSNLFLNPISIFNSVIIIFDLDN
jgi:hypothetical protein